MKTSDFICNHGDLPEHSNISVVSSWDRDVRQEAAVRLLTAFDNLGVPYATDEQFIQGINENEPIAKAAIVFEVRNRIDSRRKRSPNYKKDIRVTMYDNAEEEGYIEEVSPNLFAYPDEYQEIEEPQTPIEVIEDSDRLRTIYECGDVFQKRTLLLMAEIYLRKKQGETLLPRSLYVQLCRYKKKTGWKLDISSIF